MRRLGLRGLPGPRKASVENLVNAAICEDLVQRQFRTSHPNHLWLTDITEHPTSEGKVYCCVVLDLYSRKVVGWAIECLRGLTLYRSINAPMESFWGSMQVELLNRQRWQTIVELAAAIADCIEHFYNPPRRHSALGYLTERIRESTISPHPLGPVAMTVFPRTGSGHIVERRGFEPLTSAVRGQRSPS